MSSGMRPLPPHVRQSVVVSSTTCPASVTVSTKPRPPHSWHGTLTEIVSSADEGRPRCISEESSDWAAEGASRRPRDAAQPDHGRPRGVATHERRAPTVGARRPVRRAAVNHPSGVPVTTSPQGFVRTALGFMGRRHPGGPSRCPARCRDRAGTKLCSPLIDGRRFWFSSWASGREQRGVAA